MEYHNINNNNNHNCDNDSKDKESDNSLLISEINKLTNQIKELESCFDIQKFFLRKYQQIHQEIKANRFLEIEQDTLLLEEEIKRLTTDHQQVGLQVDHNHRILQKIEAIDQEIETIYIDIESARFDYESKVGKIKEQSIQDYQQYLDQVAIWFDTIADFKAGNSCATTVIDQLAKISKYVSTTGYLSCLQLQNCQSSIVQLTNKFNLLELEFKRNIANLKQERLTLELEVNLVCDQKLEEIKQGLATRIELKNKYRHDIENLFKITFDKHQNIIIDQDLKMNFLGYESKKKVAEFEQLLVTFKQELLSLETPTNLKYQKNKRLLLLQSQLADLKTIVDQANQISEELVTLKQRYQKSVTDYQWLNQYVTINYQRLINNPTYLNYLQQVEQLKAEINNATKEIIANTQLKDQLEQQRYQATFNSRLIENLSQIIKETDQVNANLLHYQRIHHQASLKFQELDLEKDLKDNLIELTSYQKFLPQIFNKLKQLEETIKQKQSFLDQSKQATRTYQNLLIQIEELTKE